MTIQVYRCARYRSSVGPFEYSADFAEASSTIYVRFFGEDGEWQSTPYQVAYARHNRREAERLIAEYFR